MNRFLSHKRAYPSPRLEVLLRIPNTRLVSSDMLGDEFRSGRVPIYVLDKVLMTPKETTIAIDPQIKTLWITKELCDEPILHEMISQRIGTDRTGFRIFTKESRIREVSVADSVDEELVEILNHILSVASFSNVSQQELMVLAEFLLISRLAGNTLEYPFSKLVTFDQGIVVLKPQDIITCTGLRKIVRTRRMLLQDKVIQVTIRICNRLFKSLQTHPEYKQKQHLINPLIHKWRKIL